VEIVGYFDRTRKRAESMVELYGGRVFDTVEELLADESIEAVSICIANKAHAEVSIQALNEGKHVLCEKPMATTVEECEQMLEAAKRNNRFLMIAQNQRFNTGHIRAKELLEQGIIGTPLTFKTTFCHGGPEAWLRAGSSEALSGGNIWFFDKKVASMGVLADLGIHKMDLIQFLLDADISEVTAKVMTLDKRDSSGRLIDLEDNALCILKLDSGVYGTLTASWTDYGEEDNSTVIFGTKGLMRLYDNSEHTIQISTDRGDKIYYDLDRMMTNLNQRESGMVREFVRELITGEWTHAANESSVNAIRAVLSAFQSSAEDRTIKLKG
jgi:predicted dehydrogenase